MKKCKIKDDCIAFKIEKELLEAFTQIAGCSVLDDNTIVEGNSRLTFGKIKKFVEIFGLENVYFVNSFEHGFIDEIYSDVNKIKNNSKKVWFNADESCYSPFHNCILKMDFYDFGGINLITN